MGVVEDMSSFNQSSSSGSGSVTESSSSGDVLFTVDGLLSLFAVVSGRSIWSCTGSTSSISSDSYSDDR